MKNQYKTCLCGICLGVYGLVLASCHLLADNALSEKEQVGKLLFFDESLSEPGGQSCATCHTPATGFADKYGRSVSEGAVKKRFSNRNSMTIAYAAYVPALHYDPQDETYVGGLFWDGRSGSLQHQASQPFVNPVEMGNATASQLVQKVKKATYFPRLQQLYGKTQDIDSLYLYITDAIAAYERSQEVNPFSSKFDAWEKGEYQFSPQEAEGMQLFQDKGMCAECHVLEKDAGAGRVLFTDHTYDNLGIPANPHNPFFEVSAPFNPRGRDTVDLGIGGIVRDSLHYGKFRVPTLRNIALTAPYGHNGYFGTLQEIVHFYNVRDVDSLFGMPEYAPTVNHEELGNLRLTPQEEASIVAFLQTLTDGYYKKKRP